MLRSTSVCRNKKRGPALGGVRKDRLLCLFQSLLYNQDGRGEESEWKSPFLGIDYLDASSNTEEDET